MHLQVASVSAFAGKGKLTAVKCLMSSPVHVHTFQQLGSSWETSEELVHALEVFTCRLYKGKIYCSMRGKISGHDMPPCHSAFAEHCKRANYQARIWRLAPQSNPDYPSPVGHEWEIISDGDGTETWIDCKLAPEEVRDDSTLSLFYSFNSRTTKYCGSVNMLNDAFLAILECFVLIILFHYSFVGYS